MRSQAQEMLNILWLWVSQETLISHPISPTQETPSSLKMITNPVKSPHNLNGLLSGRKLWGQGLLSQ